MKKIVLTGGGTAGHVTPNLALLPSLQERGYEIHYIGSYNGIEKNSLRTPEFLMTAFHPANCAVTLISKTFLIRSVSSRDMPKLVLF